MSDQIARLNAALAGRYRVQRELGQGGMATVYLAVDVRHERNVALKVLRSEIAAVVGAQRFLAEIKTTANLQHPRILPLFDSGEADGFLFYVMPYVQGESLRERLDRERHLPVDEAVRIATQVAEALDHAHAHGVVHRDIKPANILLHQGNALVSDFGIALAIDGRQASRFTETGLNLGTPGYMSPEQATGDSIIGPATDIWALGCVLYEMLAGEAPYGGSTPQAILGSIITGAAEDVTKRRKSTPANVGAAVTKAIERVPSDRFTSGQAFARALGDAAFRHGESAARPRWKVVAAAGVVVYLLGVLTWSAVGRGRDASDGAAPVRLVVARLGGTALSRSVTLSNDGVYLAHSTGSTVTIRRTVDSGVADTVAANGGAPFFSPDGESVAYFGGESVELVRVSRTGGTPTVLARGTGSRTRGGVWGEDGTIVWATTSGLYRVAADGGEVQLLASPDTAAGELEYTWPELLPDGGAVLFTIVPTGAESDRDASIASLDLESGEITTVLTGGGSPRYLETGHLVYSVNGTLHAVEFDARQRRVGGERAELPIEDVAIVDGWGADFDVASDGTLAYQPSLERPTRLVWRDRSGREEPLPTPPGSYRYPRISPDGRHIAYDKRRPGGGPTRDIYLWDLERETEIRLTNDPGEEFFAEWSRNGDSIYYSSDHGGGPLNIYRRAASGSGVAELVFAHGANHFLSDLMPDGSGILVSEPGAGRFDLLMLSLEEPVRLDTLVSTPGADYNGFVSPDGRLYAYQTDRDGQYEVWVSPLEASGDAPVKVSIDGGSGAGWSPTGDEVFFTSREGVMMAARIVTTPRLDVGDVIELFPTGSVTFGAVGGRGWDVSPLDGRFLMTRTPPALDVGIRVVLHWDRELLDLMGR